MYLVITLLMLITALVIANIYMMKGWKEQVELEESMDNMISALRDSIDSLK